MANQEHETRAGYAVGVWNRWRDENPDVVPNLSGAKLSKGLHAKRKLFGANLERADFRGSNMRGADLHNSNLAQADLSKTDLRDAILTGCNLTSAELQKASLIGADLSGSDLTGADLEKAQVEKSNLTGVVLKGAKVRKTDFATTVGVTQAQIDEARGDSTTKLPDGIKRPDSWPKAKPKIKP